MKSSITIDVGDFKEMFPHCKNPDDIVEYLNELLPINGINTVNTVSGFLAQTGHESAHWSRFVENLNYSEKALRSIFGKYFTVSDAAKYARKPEKIANKVYANRMGNGDVESGDGWLYRGHGAIQLTGYQNHLGFQKYLTNRGIDVDVMSNPDQISTDSQLLVLSAVYFWNREGLTEICETGDIKLCTRIINGGYNGLDQRTELFNAWKNRLSN